MPRPWTNVVLWPNQIIDATITNILLTSDAIEYVTVDVMAKIENAMTFCPQCADPLIMNRSGIEVPE